jgi:putative peptidoglycan lipid II flippase
MNIGIILGIIFLVPHYGIYGVAWGVVLGAFLHMAAQYPAFLSTGYIPTKESIFFWKDKRLQSVLCLMIPRSLSMGITQISLFVVTIFASTLAVGSLAAFNFANNIQSVPLGIFGLAFSLAAFPVLSAYAAKKKHEEFFYSVINTSKRILFFVIPLSVAMILFRAQFVRIILGSGAFDWEDTIMTFEILRWFALSLFAQCLIPLFARSFFALKNTKTPLYIALFSEAIHIIMLVLLLPYFQERALAISFSIGTIVNFLLLYVALRKQAVVWKDKDFLLPVLKMCVAALAAGIVAQVSKSIFALTTNELDTFIEVFLQLCAGLLIGGGTYFAVAAILKVEEIALLHKLIFQKLLRRPAVLAQVKDHPERGDW